MDNFIIWQYKDETTDEFKDMPIPSTYDIEYEDLDDSTYRSKVTGNLIDTVVGLKWSKLLFNYRSKTALEIYDIFQVIDKNPIIVKALNPRYNNETEMAMRCSRANLHMNENRKYDMSFNLVQKLRVDGQ